MKLRGSSLLKFQEREAKTTLYNKDFVSRVCLWIYSLYIAYISMEISGSTDLRINPNPTDIVSFSKIKLQFTKTITYHVRRTLGLLPVTT